MKKQTLRRPTLHFKICHFINKGNTNRPSDMSVKFWIPRNKQHVPFVHRCLIGLLHRIQSDKPFVSDQLLSHTSEERFPKMSECSLEWEGFNKPPRSLVKQQLKWNEDSPNMAVHVLGLRKLTKGRPYWMSNVWQEQRITFSARIVLLPFSSQFLLAISSC